MLGYLVIMYIKVRVSGKKRGFSLTKEDLLINILNYLHGMCGHQFLR